MNLSDKKYDAFISYRHGGIDQYIAENLHKKLEAFRLPKNILKSRGENDKTRITRVFRDRDELPLASDLADPITNALKNSEFLIVICTKRLSESKWCMKEIETFIEFHGQDKIFAVLAEGEPQDSFPDILRFSKKIVVDANGFEKEIEVEVEPLAADVRGKDNAERNKKLKEEVLRLAAPMFQLGYDDLRQRHREQVLKRRIMLASSIAVVGVTFATISTALAFTIQKQSVKISQQSEKIQKQFTEALIENNKNLAENALIDLREGNVEQAIKTAVSALPKDEEDTQMPYVPQAEYALSQALRVYENGYRQMPAYLIDHDAKVVRFDLSKNKDRVLSIDKYGQCNVYDAKEKKSIFSTKIESGISYSIQDLVTLVGNSKIIYPDQNGLVLYDFEQEKEVGRFDAYSLSKIDISENESAILVCAIDKVWVLDATTLEEKGYIDLSQENVFIEQLIYNDSKNQLILACHDNSEIGDDYVKVIDLTDVSKVERIDLTYKSINNMYLKENQLFIVANQSYKEFTNFLAKANGSIECYDMISKKQMWRYESEKNMIDRLEFQNNASDDLFIAISYNMMKAIHAESGVEDEEYRFESEIVGIGTYDGGGCFVITQSGIFHGVNLPEKVEFSFPERFISHSDNLGKVLWGDNFAVALEKESSQLCYYKLMKGSKVELLYENRESISDITVDEAGEKAIVHFFENSSNVVSLLDIRNKKVIKEEVIDDVIYCVQESIDQDQFFIVTSTNIYAVDKSTGDVKEYYTFDSYNTVLGCSQTGDNLYFVQDDNLFVFDFASKKVVKQIKTMDEMSGFTAISMADDLSNYVVANIETKSIEKYSVDTNQMLGSMNQNVDQISALYIDDEQNWLYVAYKNDTVSIYEMNTFELVHEIDGIDATISEIHRIGNCIFMIENDTAYILNNDGELVNRVKNYKSYANKTNTIFMTDALSKILTVPKYDRRDLLEEAQ